MPPSLNPSLPSRFWRAVALFGAGMVLLLGMANVSPDLHAWIHQASQTKPDPCPHHHHASHAPKAPDAGGATTTGHECAVTLFSHGVVYHAAAFVTQPCEGILRAVDFRAFERLALAQPRYLHRPPQAPPAV